VVARTAAGDEEQGTLDVPGAGTDLTIGAKAGRGGQRGR
jgi:hypothetical protein